MHNPRNRPPVPTPLDVLPDPRCTLLEDLERTVRWDVIDTCEVGHRLPEIVLDFDNVR